MKSRAPSSKQTIRLNIKAELLKQARSRGLDLSATLESAITRSLLPHERARWLEANRSAIAAYNRHVEDSGMFSDGVGTMDRQS